MKRKAKALLCALDPRTTALFVGGDPSCRLPRFNERWHRVALHMRVQKLLAQGYRTFLVETGTPFGRMALAELARLRPGGSFQLWSLRRGGASAQPDDMTDAPWGPAHSRWELWRAALRCDRRLGEITPPVYDQLLQGGVGLVVTPAEAALLEQALLQGETPAAGP